MRDEHDSKIDLGRRSFLQAAGLTAATATVGAATGITPIRAWSENGRKILAARTYGDLTTMDPGVYQNTYNVYPMNCVYQKLIDFKPGTWDWQLQAAKHIEQIDDTHIRFELKPGIMFSDGYGELTADDVKFSFERVISDDLNSPVAGDWGTLDHVEVEDKYTGVIVFSKPYPPMWTVALPYAVGCIVSRKATEEIGGQIDVDKARAFSGPYKLKEWRPKEVHILVPNDAWTGTPAEFDEIRLYPIDDEKSGEIAYEAGDLNFTQISLSSLEDYKADPPENTEVEVHPSLYYVWLGMNTDHPKLKDKRVRQAIQYGINIPAILNSAYFGFAEPSTGIIAPGLVGHRESSIVPPEGDLKKSRELLDQAGVSELTIKLDVLNKSTWTTAAQVIQATLAEVGINVEVNVNDSGAFWTIGMESEGDRWKDMQLILNRFSMTPDPYYATQWFTCDQVGKWNWERFCNERFDELNRKAAAETDTDKRAQMYQEMQALMEESGAYRFITHEATPIMYRTTKVEAATRPDGHPLHRFFKSV
jgi:peptide/nickel transport system substrate-binding protein